jgi:hypothetical protein
LAPDLWWRVKDGKAETSLSQDFTKIRSSSNDVMASLRAFIGECKVTGMEGLPPMAAGAFGYIGYDMVRYVETQLPATKPDPTGVPEAMLLRPGVVLIFDGVKQEIILTAPERGGEAETLARLDAVEAKLDQLMPPSRPNDTPVEKIDFQSNTEKSRYLEMVEKAKDYVRAGVLSRFPFVVTGISVQVPVGGFVEQADVWQGEIGGVPVYLLDHSAYFNRDGLYGTAAGDFPDNGERFGFFCHAALELCKWLDFVPDVIHGNDWQCGLLPVFLRTAFRSDPFFAATGTLFTIHNLGYQGHFPATLLKLFGFPAELNRIDALEFYGALALLKGGVVFSDVVTTVSDNYCREIQTPEYGHGFDGILRARQMHRRSTGSSAMSGSWLATSRPGEGGRSAAYACGRKGRRL